MNGRWKVPPLIRIVTDAYAAVGIALIYFDARLRFTPIWSQAATGAYVLVALILINLPAVRKSLGFTPLMHGAGLPLFVAGVLWWLGVLPWSLPGFAAAVDVLCTGDFDGVSAAAGIASVNATVRKANFLSIVRILPSRFPGIPVNRAQCLNIRPASTCSTPK